MHDAMTLDEYLGTPLFDFRMDGDALAIGDVWKRV